MGPELSFLTYHTTRSGRDVRILYPRPHHVQGLATLSANYAENCDWVINNPVAQTVDPAVAHTRLFGDHVIQALVAETEQGEMVGYISVQRGSQTAQLSLLVAETCRRSGLARHMVETVLSRLPAGLCVEASVNDADRGTLTAMTRLGFTLDRTSETANHTVYVFSRHT